MNETTTRTESVNTVQLQTGDIIRTHGLRVQAGEHHTWQADNGRTVHVFQGTILNPEYLQTDTGRYLFGGIIPLDGSDLGWTIQGNELAYWTVER